MTELLFVVEEQDDGGFLASAVGASIVTQAEMLEELRAMVRDAAACHFDEADRPRMIRLHSVRDEVIAA